MAGYYERYDWFGELKSLTGPHREPAPAEATFYERMRHEFERLDDADSLYEELRYSGMSHVDARAKVKEVFSV